LVTLFGEYQFQLINKTSGKPILIDVFREQPNSYKIQFSPLPIEKYVLRAKKLLSSSTKNSPCEPQLPIPSQHHLINAIIDQIPDDLIDSNPDNDVSMNLTRKKIILMKKNKK
jgi:hypothetical protein